MPHTIKSENILIIILGMIMTMEMLDAGALNTSLPQIALSLQVNPISLKIAITTYLLALGAFIPMASWVSDRFGLTRVMYLAITGFLLASIVCGAAQNLVILTIARAFQGIFGAFMMPLARLTIVRVFKERLTETLSKTAPIVLFGAMIGPIVGGTVTTVLNWRFIFFINVPIGLLIMGLMLLFFPKLEQMAVKKFDLLGFLLLAIALSLTLFAVDTVIDLDINMYWKLGSLFLAIALFLTYFFHSKAIKFPVINLNVFRKKMFSANLFYSAMIRIFTQGLSFLIPLYVQTVLHYSAFESGLTIGPFLIGALLAKFSVQYLVKNLSHKKLLSLLLLIFIGAQLVLSYFLLKFDIVACSIILMVIGWCSGIFFPTINTAIYKPLTTENLSVGITINSAVIQLTGSFTIAIIALILIISSQSFHLNWDQVLPKYAYATVLWINTVVVFFMLLFIRKMPLVKIDE
jgi:EmrB/QacA subfamily drug resistance transporter